MSKCWYPVINYENCEECGACSGMCMHGVYDKQKAPAPAVIYKEGCIEGCHGCGSKCPNGAITYAGDNTGWVPPHNKNDKGKSCGCGGNC